MLPKKNDIIIAEKETHLYLSPRSWRTGIDWLTLAGCVEGVYIAPAGILVRYLGGLRAKPFRGKGYLVPPPTSTRKFLRGINPELNFYQVRVDFDPHDFSFYRTTETFNKLDRETAYKKAFGVE